MSDSRRYKARSDNYKESLCLRLSSIDAVFSPCSKLHKSGEQNCTVLLSFICEDNAFTELQMLIKCYSCYYCKRFPFWT